MFRSLRLIPVVLTALAAASLPGATLQQLSMDQLTQSATAIVRARVTGVAAVAHSIAGKPEIYTHYKLAVSEVWKTAGAVPAEVMLPGGDLNGQKQSFPGVPELRVGGEYILFLWKSPATGIIHPVGLTQGIFDVTTGADGAPTVSRRQTGEMMLDASGHRVFDQAVKMKMAEMKSRVRQAPVAGTASIASQGSAK